MGASLNGIITNTTGAVTYEPIAASFTAAQTFPQNANYILAQNASSLTIGKPGNTGNVTIGTAQTVAGTISIYGGTVTLTGAVTATNSTLTLGASTALTQTGAISASSLELSGAGTFTLSNTSNNVATIAGGTSASRLGSLSYTDASGGLTIGTVGATSGIYTTGTLLVETLNGDIHLNESVSSGSTSANALIINAGKSSAIGTNTGGNILVSGTPTLTVGSGGIGKLFSGLETNSTGLTTLVGGSGNVRYDYDETTTTYSPVLSTNNIYAIYRTNFGTGDLTIVASGGDAINSTWIFDNGTISTTSGTVNINASVLVTYLSSGALTIEAGNVTINSAITSSAANAFIINSNGVKTITVNSAVSLGGAATFNSDAFVLGNGINISTSTASDITINTNAGFSTTSTTRRTISSAGGNIVIHADKDANGSGALDLDYLTIDPGAGNIIIRGETAAFLVGAGQMPYINGTGSFTFESSDASFGSSLIYTSWFSIDQDANGISGLTIGKPGNTADVDINSNISIGGPVMIYGDNVEVNGTLTSSATGDIFIKGIAGTNPSIWIQSGASITKSGGTGTLTLQGHGRVSNQGSITTSGTGVLNVIFWSDFDNDNDDGGVSQQGTISTNGGHVWLGGSSSNGGSYTWNGLTVGDGPSIGSTGFNGNAMDIYGNITTNGGDFLAWAGSMVSSGGIAGIANDGSGDIVSVGSGNIVLITDMVYGSAGAAMYFTQSGGTFTLVPHGGSFRSTLNWNPAIQTYIGGTADDYNLQTGDFDWLGIGEFNSIARLTIGYYNGMLSNGTPVEFTNSSNITFSTATTAAGAFELYGGAIALNTNLTTTSATNGNIVLNGTTVSGTANLAVAAGRNATISVSSPSTYDGIISGTGSGFTKAGAGLLTLTKDHTYSGATSITGGDLQVGTGGSVSQASSGTISNTTGVAVSSGSKLVLSPNENITFAAPVSGDGGVEVKGASGLYRSTALTTTASLIASNVSVLEVLTRITGGTFTGSAASGNCGAYQKSYNAATNTATLQFQQLVSSITKVVFVTLERINTTDVAIRGTGAVYRSGDYLGQNMATIGGTTAVTFPTQYGISQVFMSGKVNFTGALTYTGTTTLSNTVTSPTSPSTYSYTSKGTQEITDASSSFPGAIVNNGLVIFNRTTALTIAGDMSGTEDVLQVGAAITLTGTNTHTGTTTVDLNKILNIGSGGSTGSMTGNIVNYGDLAFNRTGNSTYPGVVSGTGTLTKSGSGDLTLNNLNTYSGATTVNAGRLILEQDVPTTSSSSFSGAGRLVIRPSSASFTNAISYPISGFNVSSTIGGLEVGKLGNTADFTVASATTAAGPITFYGGTMNVNENIAPTNTGNISLYANTLNFGSGKKVSSSGAELLIAPSTVGNTIGVAGSAGSLQIPDAYFTTNFEDGFSNITIGSDDQTGNIVTRQVTLRDNIGFKTSGTLTIEQTPFDITTFSLTLGSGTTVLGMPTNYIKTSSTGVVKRSISNAGSGVFPIGNLTYNPVTIANNTGAADEFNARVLEGVFQDGYSVTAITDKVVNRTWHIGKTAANASSGVDLTFQWEANQELGTMPDYKLSHYGTFWALASGTSGAVSGTTTKTMTHTGYTGTFSPFAVGSSTGSLPVSWVDFTAVRAGQSVALNWRTGSEQNTKDFVVQHSTGNGSWKNVGNVAAAGFSSSVRSYRFTHSQPVDGRNLYRLLQRDLDGKESLSKVVGVVMPSATSVQVYPVPSTNGTVFVKLPADQVVKVFSSTGVLMLVQPGKAGVQLLQLQSLPKGLYYLQAGKETVRVLLQ